MQQKRTAGTRAFQKRIFDFISMIAAAGCSESQTFQYQVFQTGKGCQIRYCLCFPEHRSPRALILILHGRAEFIEKYQAQMFRLLAGGYAVATFDWRGQGLSCRELENRHKGYVASFEDYLADLDDFFKMVISPAGLPVSILAHSMGGHLALRFMARHPGWIQKAVLAAPMIDIRMPAGMKKMVKRLAEKFSKTRLITCYTPGARNISAYQLPFSINRVTHDEQQFMTVRSEIEKHPDLALGGATWGWLNAAFESIEILWSAEDIHKIQTSVTIVTALDDKIVCPDAQQAFVRKFSNISVLALESASHEIMFELPPIRRRFWEYFDHFMAS